MKPLDFHPDAAEEVRAVAEHYLAIRAELGVDFRAELAAALRRIRENPLAYAVESGEIRICPFHRFPYSVYYQDLGDRIWVAAVGHQHRRPGYWRRRRPN